MNKPGKAAIGVGVGVAVAVGAAWWMDHLGAVVLLGLIVIYIGATAWAKWTRRKR